ANFTSFAGFDIGFGELFEKPDIGKRMEDLATGPIEFGDTGDIGLQILRLATQILNHLGDGAGQVLRSAQTFALRLVFVMAFLVPGLLLLLLDTLLLMELQQERNHRHGILLQIFDIILFFLFCSFAANFFFLLGFDVFRLFSTHLVYISSSDFLLLRLLFLDFADYLLFRLCFNLIILLLVSYSLVHFIRKNTFLRVLLCSRIIFRIITRFFIRFSIWV